MRPAPPRFLLACAFALLAALRAAAADSAPAVAAAQTVAARAFDLLWAAAAPAPDADPARVRRDSLGATLAHYAANPGLPARAESPAAAARRLVAGTPPDPALPPPDRTALRLRAAAAEIDTLLGPPAAAESAPVRALRLDALLLRFHARRLISAVHYGLFLRNLRLPELVAATLQEKDTLALWRDLVRLAGDDHPLAAGWRAELRLLENNLKDLEDQCCPPDEAVLREKVWEPARS